MCWPGLCKALLKCLQAELAPDSKKVDANYHKALRVFTTVACHASRAGCLARTARSLFWHITNTLTAFGAGHPVADDAAQALDKLLADAACAPLCVAPDLARLISFLTGAAAAAAAARPPRGAAPHLRRLEHVLAACPASLPAPVVEETLRAFVGDEAALFARLAEEQNDLKLSRSLVAAFFAFLQHHGAEALAQLPPVLPCSHALLQPGSLCM